MEVMDMVSIQCPVCKDWFDETSYKAHIPCPGSLGGKKDLGYFKEASENADGVGVRASS